MLFSLFSKTHGKLPPNSQNTYFLKKNLSEQVRKKENLQDSFETASPDYPEVVIFNEVEAEDLPLKKKGGVIFRSCVSTGFYREQLTGIDDEMRATAKMQFLDFCKLNIYLLVSLQWNYTFKNLISCNRRFKTWRRDFKILEHLRP